MFPLGCLESGAFTEAGPAADPLLGVFMFSIRGTSASRKLRSATVIGAALLVSALSLAACGEDDSPSDAQAQDVPAEVTEAVDAAKEPPTNVGTTEALPEAPP